MLDKLDHIEKRYEELTEQLSDRELLSDQTAYTKVTKQHRSLGEVVAKYREYKNISEQLEGARELLEQGDDEMREMAQSEIESLTAQLESIENQLKFLLIPTDPMDEKNVILEIRAGTGGDEATLFAAEMLRMYSRY